MGPAELGVNVAIEAHRRGLLDTKALSEVLTFYEGLEPGPTPSPTEVLCRHGLAVPRVLALVEECVPGAARRFSSRLTIHRELGRGAMGVVSQAYDRVLKRVVALKSIRLGGLEGERGNLLRQRFEREAEVMARLRHPAIATLHDANVDEQGDPYLVMEFVPGRTLDRVIEEESPLEVRRVVHWGASLAEALQACHAVDVVHRDVKPSNVMITPDDRACLIDFGVALDEQVMLRLTAPETPVGTLLYMAPEQMRLGLCGPPADIYSLGATLHEALVGRPPLEASHPAMLTNLLLHGQVPEVHTIRSEVPRPLSDVLLRCLAKEPKDRPDARHLAAELNREPEPRVSSSSSAARVLLAIAGLAAIPLAITATRFERDRPPSVTDPVARPAVVVPSRSRSGGAAEQTGRLLPEGIRPGEGPNEFINEKDGSVLVYVPAGEFSLGHPATDERSSEILLSPRWNDRPAHRVRLSGYFIGKYEVSWSQFQRYLEEAAPGRQPTREVKVGERIARASDEHPVFHVRWREAVGYCHWAGLRLPTEAQWEFAARGPGGQLYPWGDSSPTPEHANLYGAEDRYEFTSPRGSFPLDVSPFGCLDMAGNVSEWVSDFFGPYSESTETDPRGCTESTQMWAGLEGWRPLDPGEGPYRVIRGGAWTTSDGRPPDQDFRRPEAYVYKVTRRFAGLESGTVSPNVGFRVCR